MAKYRKKPVIVEAEQFFIDKKPHPKGVVDLRNKVIKSGYGVITIHKQMAILADGDWIIEESDGVHHYPCKPDEFQKIYEKVEG